MSTEVINTVSLTKTQNLKMSKQLIKILERLRKSIVILY
jgi:hypothetical protein